MAAIAEAILTVCASVVTVGAVMAAMAPSPQQIKAADGIFAAFVRNIRYAILKALCQVGKTGAYHTLIRLMIETGMVQRAIIVCGSAETGLRSQAHKDAMKHNKALYEAGLIKIYFHDSFKKATMDVTNALIIVDESHLVQTKHQLLHRFLGLHGITMDGRPTNLMAKNTYVVSVDATPYSELAALHHKETPFEKHIEELEPGSGYIGLSTYNIIGLIQPTFSISAEKSRFASLLASKCEHKYALMRLCDNGPNAAERTVREICAERGYTVFEYTSKKTEIAITREEQEEIGGIPCLEDAPAVPTVVIIRGRLRAGKVVPKKHVGFVWEGAKNSKTDALVQGLLGRMCGYDFGQPVGTDAPSSLLPTLFAPPSALAELKGKVVPLSEIDRATSSHCLPRKGTHLKKGIVASAASDGKYQCPPLRLEWPAADSDEWRPSGAPPLGHEKGINAHHAKDLLKRNLDLLATDARFTPHQKAEIRDFVARTVPHARHLVGESQLSYYKSVLEAHKNGTTPAEHISDFHPMTFLITYDGYKGLTEPGANKAHVYVIFYTKSRPLPTTIHALSRIPKTTGKSIFGFDDTHFDRPIAAAGAVGIAVEDIKVPEKLEARLRDYVTLWRTSALVVSREIVAPLGEGCFKLSKRHYHYNNSDDNDVKRICARLSTEFGIKLEVKYARCSADMFNLRSIKW